MNDAEQKEFSYEAEDFKSWFDDSEGDLNPSELVSQTMPRLFKLIDILDRRLRNIEQKMA